MRKFKRSDRQIDDFVAATVASLDDKDATLIRKLFLSYGHMTDLVVDKTTTIYRLRQFFFGKRTEKTKAVAKESAAPTAAGAADGLSVAQTALSLVQPGVYRRGAGGSR